MNIYIKLNKIINNMKKEVVELGKQSGIFWNESNWITSITSDNCTSEEEARKNLLDKLSQYKSVKVLNDKSGVKKIQVDTGYKYYFFTIHAHHAVEKVGEEEATSPFTDEIYMVEITKPIVYASLERFILSGGDSNWAWKTNNDYDLSVCKDFDKYEDELYKCGVDNPSTLSKECYKRHGWEWDEVKNDYYNPTTDIYYSEYLKNNGTKIHKEN